MGELLSRAFSHQGVLAAVVTVVLLAVSEAGYRLGRTLYLANDEPRRSQIGGMQAAVLGMLGLLMGFTFSMGVERFDERRELVVTEANAIGTTWLRAGLLPAAQAQPVRELLLQYVDLRVAYARERSSGPELLQQARQRSAAIQSTLWQHAAAAAAESPDDIRATFIEALNETIDVDAARIAAGENRIPAGVWLILLLVASVGCWLSGYGAGAQGVRSYLTALVLPLLLSVVILLIFDLTNERRGFISVDQRPLTDLQQALRSGWGSGEPPGR
jgi:hypothetical protein